MKERGVLKDFLKTHKYDPGQKYHFNKFGDYSVLYEPMAYMDVSLNTFPLPRVSLSLLPKGPLPSCPGLHTCFFQPAMGNCSKSPRRDPFCPCR